MILLLPTAAILPHGSALIGLLPLALILHRLFVLAFVRRGEVFVGSMHDASHSFGEVRGGLIHTSDATAVSLRNGLLGSVRDRGDKSAEVAIDYKGSGLSEEIGRIGGAVNGQHEIRPVNADGTEGEAITSVPNRGKRDWRDLWMAERTDLTHEHGIWVKESGLLLRKSLAADMIAISPRAAGVYILYDGRDVSSEETPVSATRGFWDLLIPGAFVFLCLYPWLSILSATPVILYAIYVGIMLVLWAVAVWLDSIQRDRVAKWLHLVNRNTGLSRWNGLILLLVIIVVLTASGRNSSILPLALVIGTAVVTSWARCTSAPWEVRSPASSDNRP